MRESLTSSESQFGDAFEKINQNDPKQLIKIISSLILKSKTIINTLDCTVSRLQKTEKQKQYWKSSYFRFREACQKYINADGVKHFKHLVELQQQLKKVETEKNCLEQSIVFREKNKQQEKLKIQQSKYQNPNKIQFSTTKKRKQKFHKSISIVSFNRDNMQSEHQIVPKKMLFLQKNDQKSQPNNL